MRMPAPVRVSQSSSALALAWALVLTVMFGACAKEEHAQARLPRSSAPLALPLRVVADSGRGERWVVAAPEEARAWVSSVAPARAPMPSPPLPEAPPDSVLPELPSPPTLAIDDNLKPPVLRTPALLRLPASLRRRDRAASVELDVRVDESGGVSDALWAGGSQDSVLVQTAIECALQMRFYSALLAGQPVAVWCRQRFDFAAH
jgi:Gram-negative bacterial TonB protein C-terminal